MSDDTVFTRYYTTTASPGGKVDGGCGHLHPDPARAVACALARRETAVAVDRAGRTVLPDDDALIGAFARAVAKGAA